MTTWFQFFCPIVAAAVACALPRLAQVLIQRFRNPGKYGLSVKRNHFGPKPFPLAGAVPQHMWNCSRLHDWLTTWFEKYHTISCPMQYGKVSYYTVDTENIKYILKTNFKNFPKGEDFYERMEILLGNGIFNSDGEKWKQQRKTASAEFTMRSMRDFYAVAFTEEAIKLAGLLNDINREGVSVDLQDLFMRMTLDSIGTVGFGVKIDTLPAKWQLPLPDNAFAKAFDLANEMVVLRFVNPTWRLKRFLNVGSEAELVKSVKVLDSFTYGVIAERKLDLSNASKQQSAGVPQEAPKMDLITRFLKLAEEEKSGVDYKLIRDVVLNFVIAGRDTTAVTLSWLIYAIIDKPAVAQRLYEELRDFEARSRTVQTPVNVPDAEAGVHVPADTATACFNDHLQAFAKLLTYDTIRAEELPYLQAVISETLRLFPAVPLDPKGIKENDVLPDGTPLKKGNIICYAPYGMGRMTSIWGPDAKEFKPERWLQGGKFIPESEFKFTAFQAGLRTCLGRDSAYTQMKITAAILCRFFEFQLVEGHQVKYKMMAILAMDNGLMVNIKRREEAITNAKITEGEVNSSTKEWKVDNRLTHELLINSHEAEMKHQLLY